jgi:hypothetical protein
MSESIGSIYPTQMPGLEEAADIQAALKLYHYGTTTEILNESQIVPNSVVGHIKALDTRLDSIELTGIGSEYAATAPTEPEDGFIWVSSAATAYNVSGAVASYQNSAPTEGLVDGLLWVDKNSSPLAMYVYDLDTATWKEIGA